MWLIIRIGSGLLVAAGIAVALTVPAPAYDHVAAKNHPAASQPGGFQCKI